MNNAKGSCGWDPVESEWDLVEWELDLLCRRGGIRVHTTCSETDSNSVRLNGVKQKMLPQYPPSQCPAFCVSFCHYVVERSKWHQDKVISTVQSSTIHFPNQGTKATMLFWQLKWTLASQTELLAQFTPTMFYSPTGTLLCQTGNLRGEGQWKRWN